MVVISCVYVLFRDLICSGGQKDSESQNHARKKSTKINFLGPETAQWGGGLPREGVVAKKFVPSLESLSSLGFEERNLGCPGFLPGCPGPLGVFKKFVQKSSCSFLAPKKNRTNSTKNVYQQFEGLQGHCLVKTMVLMQIAPEHWAKSLWKTRPATDTK